MKKDLLFETFKNATLEKAQLCGVKGGQSTHGWRTVNGSTERYTDDCDGYETSCQTDADYKENMGL